MKPFDNTFDNEPVALRRAALIAGWGLFFMTLFALYAIYFIFQTLILPEEIEMTIENIRANELQFRIGIGCYLVVIVLDVLVAWALYVFLKPINRDISLLAAWFRLVYSGIYAVALTHYFNVLQLLDSTDYIPLLEMDGVKAKTMLSLQAFNDTWAIGFVFFGLHIAFLGYLAFKSAYVPKILGILLILAGLSYLIDYFARFLFPENPLPVSTYFGWGELIFMFWLLFKGSKIVHYETT
ncbi:DUF4386 domain-containing protein [Flavobacteriaceae bacterium TP-CH-4]|uniref:DUF4386 domain-containing protein n=1 Tax=Pelagihabitans pacificus TaxID=2696054 RepID=A0A967EDU0_9FLAO|nr:DUF4386 domain-containing protein [Pelagihabitans pacificus]NHF59688.1 DUF4386 domain-containing protein [Pelagihabitans pacificus]